MSRKTNQIVAGALAGSALLAAVAATALRAQEAAQAGGATATTKAAATPGTTGTPAAPLGGTSGSTSAGTSTGTSGSTSGGGTGGGSRNGGGFNNGFGGGGFGNGGSNGFNRQDFGGRNRGRDSRRGGGGNGRSGPTTSSAISDDYSLVLQKSIFARNRRTSVGVEPGQGGNERPYIPPPSPLVFNGVVDVDGSMVAFVEDTGGGRISQYRLGEVVGHSRITAINLDDIELESDGKRHRIRVGQTLDGGDAPSLTERAALSTDSGSGSAVSPTPPGPNSDILAKLKARRAAQMGGTPPPGGAPGGAPGTPPPGGAPPESSPPK